MIRSLLVLALCASLPLAAAAGPATPAPAAAGAPAWVARSNELAQILLQAQAPFLPEMASSLGVQGYEGRAVDLAPGHDARYRAALGTARERLRGQLQLERDPNVRQDLEIMIAAAERSIEGSQLDAQYLMPWVDVPQVVFGGLNNLLTDPPPAPHRGKALERLRAYIGQVPGTPPLATLARQRYEEKSGTPDLLQPTRAEIERALANVDTYVEGIAELFAEHRIRGADAALATLATQMKDYIAWTREQVLPLARTDPRLPAGLYAFRLKEAGIDIDPALLMQRAQLEYMETRGMLRQLAPLVAAAKGLAIDDRNDYVAVIRALKREKIADDRLEAHYRGVIDAIDPVIRRQRIVDMPQRPLRMRLGSAAESAAAPAPHYLPPPLVDNHGQFGVFVLPLGNPASEGKAQYDDFSFDAASWSLSAHEGRPGHDLQFAAMVERGISLARTLFAFNLVNVEGWALYAEAEMVPYEPLDGQMIALQFRLLRAARAMLDPMLNLGLIDREQARGVLIEGVGLSEAMARQELDRYTVRAPGRAPSYFHGYSRIMELRMRTELALGERFDLLAFNNFLLDQGLLPPDQLATAVEDVFVPAQRKR